MEESTSLSRIRLCFQGSVPVPLKLSVTLPLPCPARPAWRFSAYSVCWQPDHGCLLELQGQPPSFGAPTGPRHLSPRLGSLRSLISWVGWGRCGGRPYTPTGLDVLHRRSPSHPSPGGRQNETRSTLCPAPPCRPMGSTGSTYLFLLLVEIVNDDTDEKVQGEERSEDDENDEVDIHVEVVFPLGLLFILWGRNQMGDQTGGSRD